MRKNEFLDQLCERLAGLPDCEIDEIVADYARHFEDGAAAGRSEEEIARALGDPQRLARELRAEAGFRRWEQSRTPANFVAAVVGFVALVTVDFVFLLPFLAALAFFTLIAGIIAMALCLAGLALFMSAGFLGLHSLLRALAGLSLLGFGVGGGALLIIVVDCVVRLLGRYARLHYTLLHQAGS